MANDNETPATTTTKAPENSGTPNKPPEEKTSKFEKAVMDEVAAIKKHLGLDTGKGSSILETVVEDDSAAPTNGHDVTKCWCASCLFARGDD